MFSYTNLAIFTKKGNLLPLNIKSGIIITIRDDFGGNAVFYPEVAASPDGEGAYIQGFKRIYGGRFLDNNENEPRRVAIHIGKALEYRTCNVKYSPLHVSDDSVPIYTIETLRDYSTEYYKIIDDSLLHFPSMLLSQKLIFDKVSTELYETEFLYILAKVTDENGVTSYVKVNELANENPEVREWAERYKLLFFIDCREQEDFRIFTVTGDEAIWSDRAELDLLSNSVIVSGETEANYPMGWTGEETEYTVYHAPRIDLGFSGKEEGTYRQALHICLLDTNARDENNVPNIIPIGEIELIGETEGEDERYRTLFTNFGIPDPKEFDHVYKESYTEDDKPDFVSINRHSKEMFLEYDKIFPYVGTYRALINAVHMLGYDDIFFKEWYKVLDVSDEIPRGYVAYNMSYKSSGHNATLAALPLEKRIHLRKKNWLSMLYSLNRELYCAPDEYDFPYVEELYEYRTEESLMKLIALREWLEKYVMALNCRIIDIGGEGVYFERYGLHTYGSMQESLEHSATLNLLPYVTDASLSDTRVLQDTSAFITVKAAAKIEERRFSDFESMTFADFCEGVIDASGVYHTYDGSTEGTYVGTILAGFCDRVSAKLNAVSTVDTFIIGNEGYLSNESPRLIIANNEISFIPEDIVTKEKNTAFTRMPVISLEKAVLRSFTDTWEKPVKYVIYPENDPSTGVSYFIENRVSRNKVESTDYVYLIPPLYEDNEDSVNIIPRNSIVEDASAEHMKKKHYHYTSDFDASNSIVKEYTSDDTTYGFRISANNAYEIPLISIQGYSVKRPVKFDLPVNSEFYLDIIKGKLIFDDFERGRRIYVIFDTNDSNERTITVKFSYFTNEFELCKYYDADGNAFEHFIDGSTYESFIELYDTSTMEAIDYGLLKDIKVYNAGEFKVNLAVRDVYGEIYSADAPNTAKVITEQPLLTAYTNEEQSNNEYDRQGQEVSSGDVAGLYDKFCYFGYKVKYPVLTSSFTDNNNKIEYPNYPYSNDMPKTGMLTHYGNFNDKFKVVAYDRFISHDDRLDWNYYLILNRQNRYRGSRITEKNDLGAIREMYTGNVHTGTSPMARVCPDLFEDAVRKQSENFDVTVMFYNEVGAFPVIQLPGQMINAKALDNLHAKNPFQEDYQEPWGYYDDEYHLLLSHDITDCYVYTQTNDMGRITTITDSSGNYYTALSFMQDGIEWLVKTLFSEGYGSLWEYDYIPVSISEENIMSKKYAYDIIDNPDLIDASEGYYVMPSSHLPLSEGVEWNPRKLEDLPGEFGNMALLSGWLTYKGNPVLSKTFIDHDTQEYHDANYKVVARMAPDESQDPSFIVYRVPSYDNAFGDDAVFSPYYAIKPKTIMDMIPDLIEDPNISMYIYPYWQTEVRIIGVSENRVSVQFENAKYKFPRSFKKGEMVKLIWRTGDSPNDISQSSYKVVGYDMVGFVLILEGEICGAYAVESGRRYAYADIVIPEGEYNPYDVLSDEWEPDPNEIEDEPWITGYLAKNGDIDFTYTYVPEDSFYYGHPEAFVDGSGGTVHTHVFRIPAGKFVDPVTNETKLRYRVYTHNDLECPNGEKYNDHGMFSPWYESIENTVDASLYISYAYNAFTDYKMSVEDYEKEVVKTSLLHSRSTVNDKLTYYIDDTFRAVTRTFDTDNGVLYWMNASDNIPLICLDNVYAYNCPVTTYEKTPYTAFKIDYKNVSDESQQTILWRVYKSIDATKRDLLFESWNKSLFLDISKRGIYDIEVTEFDKYGNKAVHMYEGAYRILPSAEDTSVIYHVDVTSELLSGDGDYGYIIGGENGVYEEGDLCILKAVANYGYVFKGWSIDDVIIDTNDSLMFVVSRDCDIKAVFDSIIYTIDVSINRPEMGAVEIGYVDPDGTYHPETGEHIEYPYNTRCVLTATPYAYPEYPAVLYNFKKWVDNVTEETFSTESQYYFNITKDLSIIGIFDDKTFINTATSENPTYGSAVVTRSICRPGEDCSFIAEPVSSDNYEFVGWFKNGELIYDESIYYIGEVLEDNTLIAKFKIKDVSQGTLKLRYDKIAAAQEYKLTINGVETDSSTANYNSVLTIGCTLRPNIEQPSYEFIGWYRGNTKLTPNPYPYTISMPSETVSAKFRSASFTVDTVIDNESHGSEVPVETVTDGGTATITYTCYKPYEMDSYSVAGDCTDSYTCQQLTNGNYVYTFTISEVHSNVTVSILTHIRKDYLPFCIIPQEDAYVTISEENPITKNYVCVLGDDEDEREYRLNSDTSIYVKAGISLFVWTEVVRDCIFPRGTGEIDRHGLFYVTKANNDQPCNFKVKGNIMSLLIPKQIGSTLTMYGTSVFGTANGSAFESLFANCQVTDAVDLYLPSNTARLCYYRMFQNTPLTISPRLMADTLAEGAYTEMFYECTSLAEIYTKHTSWDYISDPVTGAGVSRVSYTRDWVKGVPGGSNRKFYKVAALDVSYGYSRIPWDAASSSNGWTVAII